MFKINWLQKNTTGHNMYIYNKDGKKIGEIYEKTYVPTLDKIEMKISEKGLELIKKFEGFRSEPYLCPADIPTIGYGTTRYNDGRRVTLNDEPLSKEMASNILQYQVNTIYGDAVNDYTTVMDNQNHFDALTSFTYNLGAGNLKSSTLLKKHNSGDFHGAEDEFKKWVYADGVILDGLVKRRNEESALYIKG